MGVSLENVVAMTGHSLTSVSAVFEYLQVTVTSTVIGMMALTGWPVETHASFMKGPPTPSLEPLFSSNLVTKVRNLLNYTFTLLLNHFCYTFQERIDILIDHAFVLSKEFTPQCMVGASHRPFIECAFATKLMHFRDVDSLNPDHEVSRKLLNAVVKCGFKSEPSTARTLLFQWGDVIKEHWLARAVPQTCISEAGLKNTLNHLVELIQSQRDAHTLQEAKANSLLKSMSLELVASRKEIRELSDQVLELKGKLTSMHNVVSSTPASARKRLRLSTLEEETVPGSNAQHEQTQPSLQDVLPTAAIGEGQAAANNRNNNTSKAITDLIKHTEQKNKLTNMGGRTIADCFTSLYTENFKTDERIKSKFTGINDAECGRYRELNNIMLTCATNEEKVWLHKVSFRESTDHAENAGKLAKISNDLQARVLEKILAVEAQLGIKKKPNFDGTLASSISNRLRTIASKDGGGSAKDSLLSRK